MSEALDVAPSVTPTDSPAPEGGQDPTVLPTPDTPEADASGEPAGSEGSGEAPVTSPDESGEGAPDSYDVTLPEGFDITDAERDSLIDFAKERGWSNEQLNEAVQFEATRSAERMTALREQAAQAEATTRKEWAQTIKAHPEHGGPNLEQSTLLAQKATAKLASPELRELFDNSGLANHPAVFDLMVKVGKVLEQDLVGPVDGGTPPTGERLSWEERLAGDAARQIQKGKG